MYLISGLIDYSPEINILGIMQNSLIIGLIWPNFWIIMLMQLPELNPTEYSDYILRALFDLTPFITIPLPIIVRSLYHKYITRKAKKQGFQTYEQYKFQTSLQKVRDVLRDMEPNIQVQLTRIADLSNIPKKQLKSILISITEESDIGRYLPLEEVFIRSSPEDSLLEKAFEEWSRKESDRIGKMKQVEK